MMLDIDRVLQNALKNPLNSKLLPSLNHNLQPFHTRFYHTPNNALYTVIDTPRTVGYTICSDSLSKADVLKFMSTQLYADEKVTQSYGYGENHNLAQAYQIASWRYETFNGRECNGTPFNGLLFMHKENDEPIGVISLGPNQLGFANSAMEMSIMLARNAQGQYFGTEMLASLFFYYVPAIKILQFKTQQGFDFKSIVYTCNFGSATEQISHKFAIPCIGVTDLYGKEHPKKVFQVEVGYLLDIYKRTNIWIN